MRYFTFLLISLLLLSSSCQIESDDYGLNYAGGSVYTGGDQYEGVAESPFINTKDEPSSTFSIDADGASYANIRRFLQNDQQFPPAAAVRLEEMMNYFQLDYPFTSTDHPIDLNGEMSSCPWEPEHHLVRIGIQGKDIPTNELPASNYVFLIDVSGSMNSMDKLELLKSGFNLFVEELRPQDRVAIVTYAGSSRIALPSTSGSQKATIHTAINNLNAGGGTAGAAGIITAYDIAQQNFIPNGNNRVIIGSDGDFNIGVSNPDSLEALVERKREYGVFLTVLGVGRGNLNEAMMERIANNGNGTYEYIDKLSQLKKVFIHEASKFHTVAKDVKVQVHFDPRMVRRYRLIGYENRALNNSDFDNDSVDAGEIGANQNITALYEVELSESSSLMTKTPSFTIDFRYKKPQSNLSKLISLEVLNSNRTFHNSSDAHQFTAAVAAFGMQLSNSIYGGNYSYADILQVLDDLNLPDPHGYKEELRSLVNLASSM
ncbi:MAG: vWA domain-containing protein [Croceimicrobium sp.]